MTTKPAKKIATGQIILGSAVLIALGTGAYIVKSIMGEAYVPHKSNIATVTLLKPPPVTIKEKLPEPEPIKPVEKKEEIIDTVKDKPQGADKDNAPAGGQLGLDAEGAAGADSFGLAARKGGRSLISGGDGMGRISLLSKFADYTQIVTAQIKKKILKHLDEEGGIPRGRLQLVVQVSVNSEGSIVDYKIIGSSGNHRMDDAVRQSLPHIKLSEPPPDGMPRTMTLKINSQG